MKSLVHIFKGVRPTAIDTTEKIVKGIEGDVKRGGQPVTLQDELLALLSGIRIINVDVPRTMQYKTTEYNRAKRSVTSTEKLFSLQDFLSRGPEVLNKEFTDVQDENFRVNKDFYIVLKDALEVGMPEKELKKLLRKRGLSATNANKLLKGKNIPYKAYKERMKKRVKDAEKIAEDRGERINKEYFYPKKDFRKIEKEYKNMPLDPNEKIDRSILDSVIDLFSEKETPEEVIQTSQINEIQTPPLGNTPMPAQMTANVQQKNPQTNLTRNEEALLSPTEKVIASRT